MQLRFALLDRFMLLLAIDKPPQGEWCFITIEASTCLCLFKKTTKMVEKVTLVKQELKSYSSNKVKTSLNEILRQVVRIGCGDSPADRMEKEWSD